MRFLHKLLVIGFTLAVATPAYCQSYNSPGPNRKDFTGRVGLGAQAVPQYEGGDEYLVIPAINTELNYKGFQVKSRGLGVELDLVPIRAVDAGPVVNLRIGRDGVDNPQVNNLPEINPALEMGGYVQVNSPPILKRKDSAFIRASVLQDVTGVHEGLIASGSIGYSLAVTDKLRMGVNVGTTLASDNFMNTFYSVSQQDSARSGGLNTFNADGGFRDVSTRLFANYQSTKRWGIQANAGYSRLVGDAADSTITQGPGTPNRFFGGLGLNYSF